MVTRGEDPILGVYHDIFFYLFIEPKNFVRVLFAEFGKINFVLGCSLDITLNIATLLVLKKNWLDVVI